MNKEDIQKIRIDVLSDAKSVLSIMASSDGTIVRQGNGSLPADQTSISDISGYATFSKLISGLDERVFPHAGVYDHPSKVGIPVTYSIAFLWSNQETKVFEFRFGSETTEVGELLPYFDNFISQAVALTNDWYLQKKKDGSVLQ